MFSSTAVPVVLAFITAFAIVWQNQSSDSVNCRPINQIVRVEELPEASGVAASRRTPGVFWAHNDSGTPVIFALDERGAIVGQVRVAGAKVEDWEDVAVGPCAQGSCVYVADIGDNDGERDHITVYRVREPLPQDGETGPVETLEATYPDGAHDAEAMFVTPQSDVFIITKGESGPVALYRFSRPLKPGRTALERIGTPLFDKGAKAKDRPTAADVSRDGRRAAVRTTQYVSFYRADDLMAGRWRETSRLDVSGLGEPRGEGIAFVENGMVLVGEGGGGSRPGTFTRLACTFPQ